MFITMGAHGTGIGISTRVSRPEVAVIVAVLGLRLGLEELPSVAAKTASARALS
ncbi:hypothetical protein [Roseibium polysiphoniae]|uniref:hypothetical protein n=1 Tax=Roseibium polysiphoniae TaxID=2571221 RepID=UPI0032996982